MSNVSDIFYPPKELSARKRLNLILLMGNCIILENNDNPKLIKALKELKKSIDYLDYAEKKNSIKALLKFKKIFSSIEENEISDIKDNENNKIGFGHAKKVLNETIDEIIYDITHDKALGTLSEMIFQKNKKIIYSLGAISIITLIIYFKRFKK